MTVHRAAHSIATMCRVLEVSPSGYYAWHTRPRSHRVQTDAELRERIRGIHAHSRGTYGVPRIHAELVATGTRVSRKRVARLMRQAGLRGVSRRKYVVTTRRQAGRRPAPDLVQRAFTAAGPNQLWVADITLHRDLEWIPLPGRGARCLESPYRRLGDGDTSAHGPRARGPRHGRKAAATASRHPITRIKDVNIRRSPSASGVATPAYGPRWDRSETAMTTRCARASSPRLSASSSIGRRCAPRPMRGRRCSSSSRAGTTRSVGIPGSGMNRRELRAAPRWVSRGSPCGSWRSYGREERAHKLLGRRTERVAHSSHKDSSSTEWESLNRTGFLGDLISWEDGSMGRPSRFSPEVRERAVRMVEEHQEAHASEWAVLQSVAPKLGCTAETLRKWGAAGAA